MAAIVHSQMLKLYAGPRSISGSFGASPSQAVVTAYLSQPSCVLSANAEGVVEDYTPASTTIVVEVSGRTDTSNWTISTAKSTSVGTVSVTGATVSVSGLTDDAGWVDITASKPGYEPVTRRFTLAKVRQKGGVRVATTLPANPSEVGGELAIFLDVADPALRGMYGWSGTTWIKTNELLNGSVTADKLAADAIQATKFADGIEPVAIVNLLPNVVGYTGPKLVFLTTDNKLYRYTGSSWVKELPAEDLTGQLVADQLASNSVTTGKIQAGAVATDQLAARAVTASKMVLTDTSNIYPDYDILDSSFYSGAAFTRVASTSLNRGAYALRIAANAAESRVESQWFQVEPSAEYFVELSAYQSISGTTGAAAAYIEFGSFSGGETTPTVTRSELVLRRVSTTSLARADVAVTTASNERKARLVFIREAGGTGVAEFGGPVIRRRNNAKLIVDGSIVATKIATDAVQTHHLLAGAVTAEKLTVNKLSAITADMGDVTAGTFTLSSTGYIRGGATNFATGAGFWMGYDAGTYKLRAGTPGSSGFEWTGSAFNVYGPDGSVTISSGVVDWEAIGGVNKPQSGATRNVFTGDWASGRDYLVGDIVMRGGNGWSCIFPHTSASINQPPSSGGNSWWSPYTVKGADGQSPVVGILSNESHTISTDPNGSNGNYTDAVTTMTIYVGAVDDTANWTITATPSANTYGGLVGNTYGVTAMIGVDSGYVDLTATKSGYPSITKRFTLAKSRAGAAGATAKGLSLLVNSQIFRVSKTGVITPSSISFNAAGQNLTGSPTFGTIGGPATLTGTGNSRTLTAENMTGDNVTVTLSWDGMSDYVTIVKVYEGRDGEKGDKGDPGVPGDAVDIIFRRSASQPATPAASAGVPANWYSDTNSVPAGSDPMWSCVGTKASGATNYTWQTPIKIEGSDGANGLSIVELTIFSRATSSSTPSGGTYNFATKTLTPPAGWSTSVPTGTYPVYTSRATVSSADPAATSVAVSGWTASVVSFQNGTNGTNGTNGINGTNGTNGTRGTSIGYGSSATDANFLSSTGLPSVIVGDQMIVSTSGASGGTSIWKRGASGWTSSTAFYVNGNAVIDGTLFASTVSTKKVVISPIGSYNGTNVPVSNGVATITFSTSSAVITPIWSYAIDPPNGTIAMVYWMGNTTTTVTFGVRVVTVNGAAPFTGTIPTLNIRMF